jgi:hypothetical protein
MPEKRKAVRIRHELVEKVRKTLKTGHYRGISEFVSEAVRLRLEEIARLQKLCKPSGKNFNNGCATEKTDVETHANLLVDRLEQLWLVLAKFFEDLIQKNLDTDIEIAPQLRNCRTQINFIRAHTCPGCDREIAEKTLRDLEGGLEKIKEDLIAVARGVSVSYAKDWVKKIDEARRSDLLTITKVAVPSFVPGLPRDPEIGWIRLRLSKPVAKEKVQELSKRLGITSEFQNDFQVLVKGERPSVNKAVRMIYRLQA